jgi:hypothetical protein
VTPRLAPVRGERAILAAIHSWAVDRVPRLARVRPCDAAPGDVVVLEGDGLGGHDVRAHFGPVETWTIALSPHAAVAVVPAAASGPLPVTVTRQGLRSNSVGWDGPPGDRRAGVVRIDPADGAAGVFRDDPVVAVLSHPADAASVTAAAFRVEDEAGAVDGILRLSPDARVVVWTPAAPLRADADHLVSIAGLRDLRGREMTTHRSRFRACRFTARDTMA